MNRAVDGGESVPRGAAKGNYGGAGQAALIGLTLGRVRRASPAPYTDHYRRLKPPPSLGNPGLTATPEGPEIHHYIRLNGLTRLGTRQLAHDGLTIGARSPTPREG